jgi:hypothetical protein
LTITETVLVFVVIPLAAVAAVFAIVFGGSAARGKRYRPGRQFTAAPVWFLAEEDPLTSSHRPELVAAGGAATGSGTADTGEVGGASDSW